MPPIFLFVIYLNLQIFRNWDINILLAIIVKILRAFYRTYICMYVAYRIAPHNISFNFFRFFTFFKTVEKFGANLKLSSWLRGRTEGCGGIKIILLPSLPPPPQSLFPFFKILFIFCKTLEKFGLKLKIFINILIKNIKNKKNIIV